jgi:hypothetical protein
MKWFKRKYSPVIYVLLSVAVIYSLEIVVNPVIFEKRNGETYYFRGCFVPLTLYCKNNIEKYLVGSALSEQALTVIGSFGLISTGSMTLPVNLSSFENKRILFLKNKYPNIHKIVAVLSYRSMRLLSFFDRRGYFANWFVYVIVIDKYNNVVGFEEFFKDD